MELFKISWFNKNNLSLDFCWVFFTFSMVEHHFYFVFMHHCWFKHHAPKKIASANDEEAIKTSQKSDNSSSSSVGTKRLQNFERDAILHFFVPCLCA